MALECPRSPRNSARSSVPEPRTFPKLSVAAFGMLLFSPWAQSQSLVDSALRLLLGNDSNTASFDLDKVRPKPLAPDLRALIVAALPEQGRIRKLREPLQRKLDSLAGVLRIQERESVYEVCVFHAARSAFAFLGLHERTVLLISDAALDMLDAAELQASVAHEIGHEYVWREYHEALLQHDNRRLKELELYCDGVAILTLRRVGLGPAPLLSAAQKVEKFNSLNTGPAGNGERYPSAAERRKFAFAIVKWSDSHLDSNATRK
jgi:hypothetical protein